LKVKVSEFEKFSQPAGLNAADWNFGTLLIVYSNLVAGFESGHHFADVVDVHHIGAVRAPEDVGITADEWRARR